MSRIATFPLPDVGEGLTEAEILTWHVAEGDLIVVNQVFVEIETAKAAVELPSPLAGRVQKLLVEPGVTITVGTPIIAIDTQPDAGPLPADDVRADRATGSADGDAAVVGTSAADSANSAADGGSKIGETLADGRIATLVGFVAAEPQGGRRRRRPASWAPAEGEPLAVADVAPIRTVAPAPTTPVPMVPVAPPAGPHSPVPTAGATSPATRHPPAPGVAPLATPPVRKLARDLGVDLATVSAARADGVISRAEVEAAARLEPSGVQPSGARLSEARTDGARLSGAEASEAQPDDWPAPQAATAARPALTYDPQSRETRIPVKGVRKMTALAMVASAFTAPHVTEFLTVDVTPMMELRDALRQSPRFAGVKLSALTFAAHAVCLAARNTPEINSVWDGDAGEILIKQYVHLGIAAATPRGLVVPNIRDADSLDLRELAVAINELAETARAGRTPPSAMAGGTFTITNVGVFGVDTGTPIINPGESAILALGSVKDAPWVVNGALAVRKVCQLSLSFDHRVLDGAAGSRFLADVGALFAQPGLALGY